VVRVRHRSYFSGKPGRTQGRMDPRRPKSDSTTRPCG
jgi:hypothetical protein